VEEAVLQTPAGRAGLLRSSHHRLLTLVPPEGIRITEWAARAHMSKQALGQFAAYLEDHGYVTTEADPSDRRARLARITADGRRTVGAALRRLAALEDRWRQQVGPREYATFRRVAEQLAAGRLPARRDVS
jgi:DNA-binding MarR family transcriptional regulator